ncbi:MAG: hypothetical protein KGL39_14915 [Patescibacteria group bacterium]|nr:hypothetical protein [Patescibacteria group bacterium]
MSDLTKDLMDRARKSGAVREQPGFFSVTDKKLVDAGGGQMIEGRVPNGTHRVKIVSERIGRGKAFDGTEEDQLQMEVIDNGEAKLWNVGVKNKQTGKVNYIIEALEDIEVGEEFIAEAFKMKTGKYGTRIAKVVANENVPTINLDDVDSAEAPF